MGIVNRFASESFVTESINTEIYNVLESMGLTVPFNIIKETN